MMVIMSGMYSCTSPRKLKYFTNLSDSALVQLPELKRSEAVIMPDDKLEIRISGANEVTVGIINGFTGTTASAQATSYLVDADGMVEFPLIGRVKASGLTRDQFRIHLTEKASRYLKDALVTVRFVDFRFTVLGEVAAPGTYTVNHERVTILEGMGMARDMTQFARRNNVRIIRDSSGVRHIGIIDFNDKGVLTSPYYYLQRNDVIYVEPEKNKGQIEQATRIGSIVATLVSIIAVGLTIFR
ncbi:polysaccharide biosynthesis/export family protein [Aridibaculum aurantiacum]|uniref:polysaccharide biosynthesis/export family protein n=1 Tax=Aridibaculum aurantiacum TaxID=2810307 RepID=UPI001A96E536|nr:polysaccharide biosynthesis/export family protein [Aridibaculum aurantiacum]